MTRPLGGEFSPAIADCGYRAPLTPRLARPPSLYRQRRGHRVVVEHIRPGAVRLRPAQRHASTGPHARLDVDRRAVRFHDASNQGEPHTRAPETPGGCVVHLVEALEDARYVLSRDSDPLIDNLDEDGPGAARRRPDQHAPVAVAELHRIVDERPDHLT